MLCISSMKYADEAYFLETGPFFLLRMHPRLRPHGQAGTWIELGPFSAIFIFIADSHCTWMNCMNTANYMSVGVFVFFSSLLFFFLALLQFRYGAWR